MSDTIQPPIPTNCSVDLDCPDPFVCYQKDLIWNKFGYSFCTCSSWYGFITLTNDAKTCDGRTTSNYVASALTGFETLFYFFMVIAMLFGFVTLYKINQLRISSLVITMSLHFIAVVAACFYALVHLFNLVDPTTLPPLTPTGDKIQLYSLHERVAFAILTTFTGLSSVSIILVWYGITTKSLKLKVRDTDQEKKLKRACIVWQVAYASGVITLVATDNVSLIVFWTMPTLFLLAIGFLYGSSRLVRILPSIKEEAIVKVQKGALSKRKIKALAYLITTTAQNIAVCNLAVIGLGIGYSYLNLENWRNFSQVGGFSFVNGISDAISFCIFVVIGSITRYLILSVIYRRDRIITENTESSHNHDGGGGTQTNKSSNTRKVGSNEEVYLAAEVSPPITTKNRNLEKVLLLPPQNVINNGNDVGAKTLKKNDGFYTFGFPSMRLLITGGSIRQSTKYHHISQPATSLSSTNPTILKIPTKSEKPVAKTTTEPKTVTFMTNPENHQHHNHHHNHFQGNDTNDWSKIDVYNNNNNNNFEKPISMISKKSLSASSTTKQQQQENDSSNPIDNEALLSRPIIPRKSRRNPTLRIPSLLRIESKVERRETNSFRVLNKSTKNNNNQNFFNVDEEEINRYSKRSTPPATTTGDSSSRSSSANLPSTRKEEDKNERDDENDENGTQMSLQNSFIGASSILSNSTPKSSTSKKPPPLPKDLLPLPPPSILRKNSKKEQDAIAKDVIEEIQVDVAELELKRTSAFRLPSFGYNLSPTNRSKTEIASPTKTTEKPERPPMHFPTIQFKPSPITKGVLERHVSKPDVRPIPFKEAVVKFSHKVNPPPTPQQQPQTPTGSSNHSSSDDSKNHKVPSDKETRNSIAKDVMKRISLRMSSKKPSRRKNLTNEKEDLSRLLAQEEDVDENQQNYDV